ncbi:calcium homeostasis modulator protein 5-like [Rhinichthys klamathensis goyatoka]|uniref:calcium homeostasis modulator protein 5-like n=1 Tax=Rhinichthys klamathensis goyatoka TaxID=3034132 RepID=UPI0024B4D547|nr:calcium homeostasis modulator protein 5-like [Rhinichthys klamathensis goyatoka]
MPEQVLLKTMHKYLSKTAVFSCFPLSLLLLGLEKLIEIEFVCPCGQSTLLTVFIFIGPSLFVFALMYLLLRPFKHGCSRCYAGVNDDTQQNCPKAFASCLIPPVMWAIILLLNGEYVACVMTDWKGVYVFDKELNRSWCKPTEGMRNEKELRELTRKYIQRSQVAGYVTIFVFSALTIILLGIYDCYIRGKCDSSEGQDGTDGQEALSLNSVNND